MPIWTEDQVESLKGYQECGFLHPFTWHNAEGVAEDLIPTVDGWVDSSGQVVQTWAHSEMLDWSWQEMSPFRARENTDKGEVK